MTDRTIVISDLDGTLADLTHRRHLVERPKGCIKTSPHQEGGHCAHCGNRTTCGWKPEWDLFYQRCMDDTPLETNISIITELVNADPRRELWVVSGRSDAVEKETRAWLREHVAHRLGTTQEAGQALTIKEAFEHVGGYWTGEDKLCPTFGSGMALKAYTIKMQRNAVDISKAAAPAPDVGPSALTDEYPLHGTGGLGYKLIMRPAGNFTPDDQLKRSWLNNFIPRKKVLCVFDDRARVVKMWRDEGLTCYQVDEGAF